MVVRREKRKRMEPSPDAVERCEAVPAVMQARCVCVGELDMGETHIEHALQDENTNSASQTRNPACR